MKYQYITILILILLVSGCVATDGKTVYYSKTSNETVTFYSDGTFTAISPKSSISGAYRIDGDYIVSTIPPFGTVVKVKRLKNSIVDETTGEVWEKV